MTAGGPAPRLVAALLVLGGLAGCQQARQVGEGVGKAKDCATVIRAVADLDVDPQSVARTAGSARDTAKRLDDIAHGMDQGEVRQAAENLAGKIKALASKANNSSPAQLEQQVRDVTAAATRVASTCDVPLDQVIQSG